MKLSRRDAIRLSGTTLTGFSLGFRPDQLLAGTAQAAQPAPDGLVDARVRNIADLPLLPDGSAPEHPPSTAGTISEPNLWRYTQGEPPDIEFDYRRMRVKIDSRRTAERQGTLTFGDLESLPRHTYTVLLQCGAPNPSGIVTWTGVRFSDFAEMLGIQPFAHYCRIIAADGYWIEEDMKTMMHPQVVLAWILNGEPIPPKHGAPLRLIVPFRYGARSIKAITEIYFTSTSFPLPTLPTRG